MAIKTPGKRWSKRLEKSRVFGSHSIGKKTVFADLLVTPLVDMFVIIVLFLMANFSATGEVLAMRKDAVLPAASNVKEITEAEVVVVTQGGDLELAPGDGYIILSGETLGRISELTKNDEILEIEPLLEKLKQKRQTWEDVHRSAGDTSEFPGDLNIQAHVDVPFKVIKRVMASAGMAGFGNINFATKIESAKEGEKQAALSP